MKIKLFDPNSNSVAHLEQQDYVKYLGILIDKNLSWKYHIDYVASKISRTIGIIARLRHFIPLSTSRCPVHDIRRNRLGTGGEVKFA